ncbi:MAG: Ser/Thr protein kinase RdoA (MazF antagonist), partial [Candidatus Marinamargulisbacteria bacterium]
TSSKKNLDCWHVLGEERLLVEIEKTTGIAFSSLCLKRNSYINRVYEIEEKSSKCRRIVKFYRPNRWSKAQILSEHRVLDYLSERDFPVVKPDEINGETLFFLQDIPFALFPKFGGRSLDEFSTEQWQEIGRLVGRLHVALETVSDFERDIWRPELVTMAHLETIRRANLVPFELETQVFESITQFVEKGRNALSEVSFFPIHGDCHRGNLIFRPDEGIRLIDFDDMVVGPAIQDLWMLLPDAYTECEKEIEWLASGYEVFRPFPRRELSVIPVLQSMRFIHFAAWCSVQKEDTHFKDTFGHLMDATFWRDMLRMLSQVT